MPRSRCMLYGAFVLRFKSKYKVDEPPCLPTSVFAFPPAAACTTLTGIWGYPHGYPELHHELADSLHAVLQSQTGSHFPVLLLPPQLHPNQHWHSALLSAGQSSCQQNYRVSLLLTQSQHTQQAPALSKQQASTCSQHAPSLPHDGYHDCYPTAGVSAL